MRPPRAVAVAAFALAAGALALLAFAGSAEAVGVEHTCSGMTHHLGSVGSTDYRKYVVYLSTGSSTTCPDASTELAERAAGDAITFGCNTITSGTPPTAPTIIDIYAYLDTRNFGTPGGVDTWKQDVTSSCNGTTFTKYCTSDGTSTGSPRYGGLRIVIRATVPGYNINSDNGGSPGAGNSVGNIASGIYYCKPKPTIADAVAGGASPTNYKGGDTFRSSLTSNTAPYSNMATNIVTPRLKCSGVTNTGTAFTPATTATNSDWTIKGTAAAWPDDCTLTQEYEITGRFSIDGLTAYPLFRWDQANPASGVTFTSDTIAVREAKPLDRTLSSGAACSITSGGAAVTKVYVGDSATASGCNWQDANGAAVSGLGRAYLNRVADAYTDVTAFQTGDASFGASGALTTEHAGLSTATTTTGLAYTVSVEQYGASRTDAELYNWGRAHTATPAQFDVAEKAVDDPLTVSVVPTVPLDTAAKILIRAANLDASVRTGAAADLSVTIRDPALSVVVNAQNPTEIESGLYRYTYTPTTRGTYEVQVTTTLNGATVAAGAVFRADYDLAGNLSTILSTLNTHESRRSAGDAGHNATLDTHEGRRAAADSGQNSTMSTHENRRYASDAGQNATLILDDGENATIESLVRNHHNYTRGIGADMNSHLGSQAGHDSALYAVFENMTRAHDAHALSSEPSTWWREGPGAFLARVQDAEEREGMRVAVATTIHGLKPQTPPAWGLLVVAGAVFVAGLSPRAEWAERYPRFGLAVILAVVYFAYVTGA